MKINDLMDESVTIKYMRQAIVIMDTLENDIYKLNEELSWYDKRRTDINHWLEGEFFNDKELSPTKHFYILKELQDIAVHRRRIKSEIQILSEFLKNKSHLLNENQRRNMLSDIEKSLDSDLVYKFNTFAQIEDLKDEINQIEKTNETLENDILG